ncbi:MAG: hypothetical protein P1P77_00310 [Spirochaetaceae bacterium]|nr:hypothetical protein [Spirochaetaceae bacterium]
MLNRSARIIAASLLIIAMAGGASAQTDDTFGMGLFFGAVALEGDVYNSVRLMPEFVFGDFGLAMDLDFRFTMQNNEFRVYEKDWYFPDGGSFSEYLNLYLTKFEYVRYGTEVDPLYVHLGALPGVNLGTGFIIGGYTNMNLRPERKLFGGELLFDGSLVDFPYLGVDLFTSNISKWDLFGIRLYGRPAAFAQSNLINRLEIGFTGVYDTDVFAYAMDADSDGFWDIQIDDGISKYITGSSADTVQVYGIDIIEPILSGPIASLALFGDYVIQNPGNPSHGGMVGLGGKLVSFLTYGAQIRISGENFQPTYFDRAYDLQKVERYETYQGDRNSPSGVGYLGSLGFSLLQNGLVFYTSVEGPFAAPTDSADKAPMQYPYMKASFALAEGVLPYVDFGFWYEKKGIDSWSSLVSPEYALIGGIANFRLQSAVISWITDVKYNPATPDEPWNVSTRIEAGVSF